MTGKSGGPMTVAKARSNRSHDRGRRQLTTSPIRRTNAHHPLSAKTRSQTSMAVASIVCIALGHACNGTGVAIRPLANIRSAAPMSAILQPMSCQLEDDR
jgi:hypothetical protein